MSFLSHLAKLPRNIKKSDLKQTTAFLSSRSNNYYKERAQGRAQERAQERMQERPLSQKSNISYKDINILGNIKSDYKNYILTAPALDFLHTMATEHQDLLKENLNNRKIFQRQVNKKIAQNKTPLSILDPSEYLEQNTPSNWTGPIIPQDLQQRHIELTGPAGNANMMYNSFNCGADCYMADIEDSLSPNLENVLASQYNLYLANRGLLTKGDKAFPKTNTTLLIRPRGLHLPEHHFLLNNQPIPAPLVDFSLYFFHNAKCLLDKGSAPYFYLPKLEHWQEAKWWSNVFKSAEEELLIPKGSIRSTVLIETLPAAFEMEGIIYALKDYIAGLNCGRWDYIFSFIKTLNHDHTKILPDRKHVTMESPFMQAYAQLLVQTCHKRKIHAMGGMSANVPMRVPNNTDESTKLKLEAINREIMKKITLDKTNEAQGGFDGAWAAHPDLVPVLQDVFKAELTGEENQINTNPGVKHEIHADDLLKVSKNMQSFSKKTEDGLRSNISAVLQYTIAWLNGHGAVGIGYDPDGTNIFTQRFMEDLATAEISRAQIYQFRSHDLNLSNQNNAPQKINAIFDKILNEEMRKIMDNEETVKFDITPEITALEKEKRSIPIDKNYETNLMNIQKEIDNKRKDCLSKFIRAAVIVKDICDPTKPMADFLSLKTYPSIINTSAAFVKMLDHKKLPEKALPEFKTRVLISR